MSSRHKKRVKGQPVDWNELKCRRSITLTDAAWVKLLEKGKLLGVSRSEVIERTVRGFVVWENDANHASD